METSLPRWIDNSKLSQFEICPRSFLYRYALHLTAKTPSAALIYGTAIHAGLEAGFRSLSKGKEEAMDASLKGFMQSWESQQEKLPQPIDPTMEWRGPAVAVQSLTHFWTTQWPLIASWEVVGVEMGIEAPIPETSWRYRCRIDLFARVSSGAFIVDHKTTSWPIARMIKTDVIAPQLPSYLLACKLAGFSPTGAMYNYLYAFSRKTKSGFSQPTVDCQLLPTTIPENRLEQVHKRMVFLIREIEECYEKWSWPMRLISCPGTYGSCEFLSLCDMYGWELPKAEEILDEALGIGFMIDEWRPFDV